MNGNRGTTSLGRSRCAFQAQNPIVAAVSPTELEVFRSVAFGSSTGSLTPLRFARDDGDGSVLTLELSLNCCELGSWNL